MYRRAGTAPSYRQMERAYLRHPIRTSIIMLVVAAILLPIAIALLVERMAGLDIGFLLGLGGISAILGVAGLIGGFFIDVYRRSHPIVVTCPHCHLRAQDAQPPFTFIRESYIDYVAVTCSYCRTDFTLPATARLL